MDSGNLSTNKIIATGRIFFALGVMGIGLKLLYFKQFIPVAVPFWPSSIPPEQSATTGPASLKPQPSAELPSSWDASSLKRPGHKYPVLSCQFFARRVRSRGRSGFNNSLRPAATSRKQPQAAAA